MAKYRNPRIEAEMNEALEQEQEDRVLQEPASSVEEEMWKSRYGDLRRHQQQKEAEFKSEIEELRRQIQAAATGQLRMPKSKEEVESWSREYPDFRAILDAVVEDKVRSVTRTSEEKLSRLEEKQAELAKREALLELKKRHPDLDALFKKNSDFHVWLLKQSDRDKNAIIRSLNIDDADFVIQKFKHANKTSKVDEKKNTDIDAARHVKTSGDVPFEEIGGEYDFTESQIERMSSREYEANEQKIMDAMRKGRIFYDLSGAAR